MAKPSVYRVVILGDTHIPHQDDATLSVIEQFMADFSWDEYVHLGDLLDFDMISSFNAEDLRENETRRMENDYKVANDLLDRHQKIVLKNNKKAKFTLLEGNHEQRIERMINRTPQLEGLLEVGRNLRLKERGFKWVRCWSEGELHQIGKLFFTHGNYITKYHAAKMVDTYGVNIVYGHTHDVMNYTKTILGKDKLIMGQSLGHTADEHKLKYMKKGPSNWCQAIGVCFFQPDGSFNLQAVTIINNRFVWNGKLYEP